MKAFFLVLTTIVTINVFAQQTGKLYITDYAAKSKHQKIAAWCLLGGGLTVGTIGTIVSLREAVKFPLLLIPIYPQPDEKKLNTGAVLMIIGSAATLGSIPLFIASGRNKRKIASLSIKNEPVQTFRGNTFTNAFVPAACLTIHL